MNVSIIIVNYRTYPLVNAAVNSIITNTHGLSYEIIVVDNHSGEEETKMLQADTRIKTVLLEENIGFGRGNNAGAQIAQGEMLLFLNPDTMLRNNAVMELFRYMTDHPNCGIAGGNLFDGDGHPAHSYHRMLPSIGSEMDFVARQVYRRLRFGRNAQFNHTGHAIEVKMITGADLMIRHELFDRISGFDPSFFMYSEDADLCKRVLDMGYSVISVPNAEIIHLEGRSFKISDDRVRRILTGRKCYFDKHYTPTYCQWADRLNLITLWLAYPFGENYRQRYRIYKEINNV